jgi:hypothetical protein
MLFIIGLFKKYLSNNKLIIKYKASNIIISYKVI